MTVEERWASRMEVENEKRLGLDHDDDCNCVTCHANHVENDEVSKNAKRKHFGCCQDELAIWIEKGEWCSTHDTNEHMDTVHPGWCHRCPVYIHCCTQIQGLGYPCVYTRCTKMATTEYLIKTTDGSVEPKNYCLCQDHGKYVFILHRKEEK